MASAHTPLGWPIFWMAVALGVLILVPSLGERRVSAALAVSALLYGLSYLPLSVASELRYHLWTIVAALLAAVIAGAEIAKGPRPSRLRFALALAPVLTVGLLSADLPTDLTTKLRSGRTGIGGLMVFLLHCGTSAATATRP